MFVEIVECKKLDVIRVVSGEQQSWIETARTPASFPSALIEDRWALIGATGWSMLTLIVASGWVRAGKRLRFDVSPTPSSYPSRRRLLSTERKWERDAQVITPVLILSLWTTEISISLPPPTKATTTTPQQLPKPPSNPRTSVRSGNSHETLALF